jgi:hypothetical protein
MLGTLCKQPRRRRCTCCLVANLFVMHVQAGNHDESDDDSEWTEDEEVSTPVDPVDPFLAFSDAVRHLQSAHPARFQVPPFSLVSMQAGDCPLAGSSVRVTSRVTCVCWVLTVVLVVVACDGDSDAVVAA